jgi:hypothetical protein
MTAPFAKPQLPALTAVDPLKNPYLLEIAAIVNMGDWDYGSVDVISCVLVRAGFDLDWDHINATHS